MNVSEPTIQLLILGVVVVVVTPVVLGLRHAWLESQHAHAERMRALELGRRLPGDEAWWTPARISVAIGAGVPIGVSFCAYMASDPGRSIVVWVSATVVGMTAVICGTVLAAINACTAKPVRDQVDDHSQHRKPYFDDDALDFVGSRGAN